jgi:Zn-dependent protease
LLLGALLLKGKGLLLRLLTKAKLLLALFKLKSLLVVIKTGGSMLLMIGVYALAWPVSFAIGFTLLLLVHELGHALALRGMGIRFSAPIFIPFVGALIGLKEMPPDAGKEALVAFAGPFAGTVAAQLCLVLFERGGPPVLLGLAQAGFFLNLMNLVPYSPLDGGRIVGAISPRLWLLALPVLLVAGLYLRSILLVIVGLLGLPRAIGAWRRRDDPARQSYYQLRPATRLWAAAGYLALGGFLAAMMQHVNSIAPPR